MRPPRFRLLIAALCLATATPALAARCVLPATSGAALAALADKIDAARAEAGLSPLAPSDALQLAAQGHACDQAARGHFSHTGFDGSDPARRAKRSGYAGCLGTELLQQGAAADAAASADVAEGWLAAPDDRAAILSATVSDIGLGLAQSDGPAPVAVWVVVLGGGC